MRRTDVPNEPSYHESNAPREVLVQEVELMQAWTQALEVHDGEDTDNGDEDIEIEDKEWDLNRKQTQMTE